MIHRSSKRLSHAASFSKIAADLRGQGMRSFKISRNPVNQHNSSEIAPVGCETETDGARTKPHPGIFFDKPGFSVRHYLTQ